MRVESKHFLSVALALMLMVLLSIFYVAYALFWPVKTLEIKNFSYGHPIAVSTPVVHPGDVLKYTLEYCKYRDTSAIVHRTLLDGQIIILVDKPGNLPLGCNTTEVDTTVIPDTINPGRYYLDVSVDYQVNFLRVQRTHYYTDYFQVVAADKASSSTPPAGTSLVAPTGGNLPPIDRSGATL